MVQKVISRNVIVFDCVELGLSEHRSLEATCLDTSLDLKLISWMVRVDSLVSRRKILLTGF